MLWTAPELAAIGRPTRPFAASGVSIDSRTLKAGDLFVALRAETDGHIHVPAALAAGAAGVMIDRPEAAPPGAPALLVGDTLAGLTALGAAGRSRFGGRVAAVTGSVGKTTTKEMLRRILAAFGPTHAAASSHNNQWGVPLTLARLPPDASFCVAEVGMNSQGEILPLARLVAPHVAIVTNVGRAHIGRLGSEEAIAEEKAALFDGLAAGGVAVLPADGPHRGRLAAHAPGRVVEFGPGGEVRPLAIEAGPQGTLLGAEIGGVAVEIRMRALGAHMATNALAALAGAWALGLDPRRAAAALEGFAPLAGRGEQRRLPGGVVLLDESYNANRESVRAALAVLAAMPGRRIAVLGDMLELGEFAEAEHAELAPMVARAADLVYACGPLTRSLFDRVPPGRRGAHAADSQALASMVAEALRPGDAVLVKGSLGSRMRIVVQALERSPGATGAGAAPEGPATRTGLR